jgi:hypothetical protein
MNRNEIQAEVFLAIFMRTRAVLIIYIDAYTALAEAELRICDIQE